MTNHFTQEEALTEAHPQASEPAPGTELPGMWDSSDFLGGATDMPAPSTAGERATFSQENYDATFPSSAVRKRLQEFDLRGLLAAKLTCWHRLTEKESDELVALLQSDARPVGELTDEQVDAAVEAWFGAEVEAKGFKTRMRLAIEAANKIGGQG